MSMTMTAITVQRVSDYLLPPALEVDGQTPVVDVTFDAIYRSFKRNWRFIFAAVILFGAFAVVFTMLQSKQYAVSMRVTPPLSQSSNADSLGGTFGSILGGGSRNETRSFSNFVELLHSNRVADLLNKRPRTRSIIYGSVCCGNARPSLLLQIKGALLSFFSVASDDGPSVPNTFSYMKVHVGVIQSDAKSGLLGGSLGGASLVTVSAIERNPEAARDLLLETVRAADNILRDADRQASTQKIRYLRQRLQNETNVEYRSALTNLMSEEEKRLMLVDVSEYYSLFVLDNPVINPVPYSPKPRINIFIGIGLGFVLSFLFTLLRDGKNGTLR